MADMPYSSETPSCQAGPSGAAHGAEPGRQREHFAGTVLPAEDASVDFQTVPQLPMKAPASRPGQLVLIPLCRKGDRTGIQRQINAGANVAEVDAEGNTPLHVAVEAPKNELPTLQCLLENRADPNASNCLGATPLHYVCLRKANHRAVASILLENSANVNFQTLAGKTALHFACESQVLELIEVLCLFGADVNLLDMDGNTALHAVLLQAGRDTIKRQICEILVANQSNLECLNHSGLAQIHLAAAGGYIRCVQLLMESQANLLATTSRGETALHKACQFNHPEVTQLLLQAVPTCLTLTDVEDNTPLHVCAVSGHYDCGILLVRAGADVNAVNKSGQTPVALASVRGDGISSSYSAELQQVLKDARDAGKDRPCVQS